MKTLRSIESYLRNSPISWLLRISFLTVFVVVVFGPSAVFIVREIARTDAGYQAQIRKFSRAQLIEQSWEKTRFANKIAHRAEAMGRKYSPEMYFHDLRSWKDYSKGWYYSGQGPDPVRSITAAAEMFRENMTRRYYTPEQMAEAQKKYGFIPPLQTPAQTAEFNRSLLFGFINFLLWALKAYLLGLVLCIPTFLLRLADDRQLVDAVLNFRKELLRALLMWPKAIIEFPHNIPVSALETARRRMLVGDPWGRVTEEERLQIEAFANAQTIRSWARANSGLLRQRPFWAALAATLILAYLAPFASSRANAGPRDDSVVRGGAVTAVVAIHSARDGTTSTMQSQRADSGHGVSFDIGYEQVACPVSINALIVEVRQVVTTTRSVLRRLLLANSIDHVPWLRPVGFTA